MNWIKQHKKYAVILFLINFLFSGCTHPLEVININAYKPPFINNVDEKFSIGISTNTVDLEFFLTTCVLGSLSITQIPIFPRKTI